MNAEKRVALHKGIQTLVNSLSLENESNTPDWVIADYLVECLDVWNRTTDTRERYYGRTAEVLPLSKWPTAEACSPST